MEYNPKKFKEKEVPQAGTRMDGIVTEINTGKLIDFVDEEALQSWKNASVDSPCIQVKAVTTDGLERIKTIQIPANGEVHPQSNLGKWKKAYGNYPHVEQKIYFLSDSEGWYQFAF